MIRKFGSTFALILGLALTMQSALAVDHVHLSVDDADLCYVCTTHSPAALAQPESAAAVPGKPVQFTAACYLAVTPDLLTAKARAPPVIR